MIPSQVNEKGRAHCGAPEAAVTVPLVWPASATRRPRRTPTARSAACSSSRCAGALISALSFLYSLLLSQLCFHLFSFLLGESKLFAGTCQLPPGFLRLRAILAVCPLGLTQPVSVRLLLLFQVANAIADLIAVLALESIPVLLLNL
jgi:hypothetical protein